MNKQSILLFFSFVLICSLSSCGGETGKSKSQKANTTLNYEDAQNRSQAASVIEFRKKEEGKAMAFLVSGYYEYDLIFDKKMSEANAHKGEWIKFEEDFTYTYGKYGKQQGSGKYHHSLSSGMMVMLDDDPNKVPKEYEVKQGNAFMIMVGRNTYGSNAVQMKLRNLNERPSK